MVALPAQLTEGPDAAIERVLNDRWEWLAHQRSGSAATRRATWRDLGDAGRAEDRVRQSYTGRYPIELLQNAHDACADAGVVGTVWFQVTPAALLVANQGVPFTAERIESLVRLGSSEKARSRAKHHLIGYKGIGFTAVFEVTDRPQVFSERVHFGFDRARARRRVVEYIGAPDGNEPVPARYFPLTLEPDAAGRDSDAVEALFRRGAVTVIRLPLRREETAVRVLKSLRSAVTPEILLFMQAVDRFEILDDAGTTSSWSRRDGANVGRGQLVHLVSESGERRSWLMRRGHAKISAAEAEALRDELWRDVRRLNAAVALPWSGNRIAADPVAQPVFAYFPTADRHGRGLLVHGDFYLDPSRQHIAVSNEQGLVSLRIAETAAGLAAELAASVAAQGRRLLSCLAPTADPEGFGAMLGERLDAALREARILRPANAGAAKRPGELRRIDSGLEAHRERDLVSMLTDASDLVVPGDDTGMATFLASLGSEVIPPKEIAERIDPGRSTLPYSSALGLLEAWVRTLRLAAPTVLQTLRGRHLVRDVDGNWRTPTAVVVRSAGAPRLPARLDRPELQMPGGADARAFVRRLNVPNLTPREALERLVATVRAGSFGRNDAERRAALDLAWEIWQVDGGLFDRRDLGVLNVPVRGVRDRVAHSWRRADATYFPGAWTGDRTLDALYGAFDLKEFLAEPVPTTPSGRRDSVEFFSALGVARQPRTVAVTDRLPMYEQWQRRSDVVDAMKCPDGHPQTGREIAGWAMDRLDGLLARVKDDPELGISFARGLLALQRPYGPDAVIRCLATAHGGAGARRQAMGYQRWRLEQEAWVPVTHHPRAVELVQPAEAWTSIPRTAEYLLVPRARLRQDEAKRLDLVAADSPTPNAIERALIELQSAYPDLGRAPREVKESAGWLARRLDRVAQRTAHVGDTPPLPALTTSGLSWSRSPAVADQPGLPPLPDLAILQGGRWPGLRRAYRLNLTSRVVTADVRSGPRRRLPALLPHERRVELLAILLMADAPEIATASRLVALTEEGASWLTVDWKVTGGSEVLTTSPSFLLQPRRDRAGRAVGGTLYRAANQDLDTVALGRALASYLDLPDDEDVIALYLADPARLVAQRGLSEAELGEADQLLRGRRRFKESGPVGPEPAPASEPPPPAGKTPQGGQTGTRARDYPPGTTPDRNPPPPRTYLDPERTRFGASRKPSPMQKPKRSGKRGTRAKAQGKPRQPPMPPTGLTPDPEVELRAMSIVSRYGREVAGAVEVIDVHLLNLGWDLEFVFADGSHQPVEVKGSITDAPFVITPNEWKAATEHRDFLLCQVINIGSPKRAALRVYRDLGELLDEDLLRALSWAVVGWNELSPDEIEIEVQPDEPR